MYCTWAADDVLHQLYQTAGDRGGWCGFRRGGRGWLEDDAGQTSCHGFLIVCEIYVFDLLHITYLQESARISLNFIGVLSRLSRCVWYMYTYAYLSFARRFYVTMIASSLGTPFASVAWHRWWYFSWRKTRLSFTTYEFNEIYDTKCNVFLSRNQYSGAPRVVKESHQTNWLKDNSEGCNISWVLPVTTSSHRQN